LTAEEIERWCRDGNGGAIGRTLLLPLSYPQAWEAAPPPPELESERPMLGRPLGAAKRVNKLLGYPIAVGFVSLASRPAEPIAHVFNVIGNQAVDLALRDVERVAYWGYLPTADQLKIDNCSLETEAPKRAELLALADC
jgi:hypothetical protein